jgi:predicted ATP-grasp superfamily ATP-dependent carboligase
MDKLANQLKVDAEQIEVRISNELERRIEASLQGVSPLHEAKPEIAMHPANFWWASSLTGIAAALLIVAVVNLRSGVPAQLDPVTELSPVARIPAVPVIDWRTESAMLTSPLRQELEDLQSDIEKAEQKVRREVGL